MRFLNGYSTCQVCSPSRASIMSGQYPARLGITDWIGAATGTDCKQHLKNVGAKLPKPDPRFDPLQKARQLKRFRTVLKSQLKKQHAIFRGPDYRPKPDLVGFGAAQGLTTLRSNTPARHRASLATRKPGLQYQRTTGPICG